MESVVKTVYGQVRGVVADGVAGFKGIPYAAPPYGPNRLRPPVRPGSWDGVRDATAYGPTALKPPYPRIFEALLLEPVIAGEDCLNLNVWTPDPGRAGLPVMVWIHGGAFVNGSGAVPQYRGDGFARDGIVCVTINYRLGCDGFLWLDDATPNRGLLDQLAALQWVLLPARPVDAVSLGAGSAVDLLVGSNRDESRLFTVPTGMMDTTNDATLAMVAGALGLDAAGLAAYTGPDSAGETLSAILTDWTFRIPAIRLAEAHQGVSFLYEFAWGSPLFDGRLGACHALEIGFAFDTLDAEGGEGLYGPRPPAALAASMHRAWVDFATTGQPGWAAYDLESRPTMIFDVEGSVVDDPRDRQRRVWDLIR